MKSNVRVLFLGDILLNDALAMCAKRDPTWTLFGDPGVRQLISGHDLVVGSLDCSLPAPGQEMSNKILVATNEAALHRLADLKLGLASVATNHSFDFGLAGYEATCSVLHSMGIATVGAGQTATKASEPLIVSVKGQEIGFLGYVSAETTPVVAAGASPGANLFDLDRATIEIQALKKEVSMIVVLLHWGAERYRYPTPYQRMAALRLVESGASLVVGNHPHTVQVAELIQGRPVFYALGNLVVADIYQDGQLLAKQITPNFKSIAVSAELRAGQGFTDFKLWALNFYPNDHLTVTSRTTFTEVSGLLHWGMIRKHYWYFWAIYSIWMEAMYIPFYYKLRAYGMLHFLKRLRPQPIKRRLRVLAARIMGMSD